MNWHGGTEQGRQIGWEEVDRVALNAMFFVAQRS
jgi:hypothetical protein